MFKIIALVVVALIVALLLYAATKPDILRVQRATSIKAPAEIAGLAQMPCRPRDSVRTAPPYNHGSASGKTSTSLLPDRQNAISSARLASQSARIWSLMKAVRSVPIPSP